MSPRTPREPHDDLEAHIDGLFGQPLDRFVQERNRLAAELRRQKRSEDADRVRALVRPTLPAWALNQVYWHSRADYDRLTTAGDRLRDLQRQALAGKKVALDDATRERQEAIRAVVERAAALMAEAGQSVTDATRQRIAVSADAAAAYGSRPREYTPGRLDRELQPPGFEALAGLTMAANLRLVKSERSTPAAPPAKGSAAGAKETREEARARAAQAREAERERREALKTAKQDRDARERDVERARRAESEAAAALADVRRRVEALRRELAGLEDEMGKAERGVEEARRRVSDAQDARRQSAERVRELER